MRNMASEALEKRRVAATQSALRIGRKRFSNSSPAHVSDKKSLFLGQIPLSLALLPLGIFFQRNADGSIFTETYQLVSRKNRTALLYNLIFLCLSVESHHAVSFFSSFGCVLTLFLPFVCLPLKLMRGIANCWWRLRRGTCISSFCKRSALQALSLSAPSKKIERIKESVSGGYGSGVRTMGRGMSLG